MEPFAVLATSCLIVSCATFITENVLYSKYYCAEVAVVGLMIILAPIFI